MIPTARNGLTGKAPARPATSAVAAATAAGAVALTLLVAIGHLLHRPVLVPPLKVALRRRMAPARQRSAGTGPSTAVRRSGVTW